MYSCRSSSGFSIYRAPSVSRSEATSIAPTCLRMCARARRRRDATVPRGRASTEADLGQVQLLELVQPEHGAQGRVHALEDVVEQLAHLLAVRQVLRGRQRLDALGRLVVEDLATPGHLWARATRGSPRPETGSFARRRLRRRPGGAATTMNVRWISSSSSDEGTPALVSVRATKPPCSSSSARIRACGFRAGSARPLTDTGHPRVEHLDGCHGYAGCRRRDRYRIIRAFREARGIPLSVVTRPGGSQYLSRGGWRCHEIGARGPSGAALLQKMGR